MNHRDLIVLVILLCGFAIVGGCNTQGDIIKSEKITAFDPTCAYIILNERLGNGNLVRMAVSLHMNGEVKKSKGIQLAGITYTAAHDMQRGAFLMDFLEIEQGRSGYRVWTVNAEELAEGGKCIFFVHSASNTKKHFTPFNDPRNVKENLTAPSLFQPLETISNFDTFLGCPVQINGPGVYYLGTLSIEGSLGEEKIEGNTRTLNILFRSEISSAVSEGKAFQSKMGLQGLKFYDLSGAWRQISLDKVAAYKKGENSLEYIKPN